MRVAFQVYLENIGDCVWSRGESIGTPLDSSLLWLDKVCFLYFKNWNVWADFCGIEIAKPVDFMGVAMAVYNMRASYSVRIGVFLG